MERRHATGIQPLNKRGFTLIEVLIALSVVAISLVGLMTLQGQSARNLNYLEQKTFADLVASNIATQARLAEAVQLGELTGNETLAKRNWLWQTVTKPTPNNDLVEMTIAVFSDEDERQSISELTVYLPR